MSWAFLSPSLLVLLVEGCAVETRTAKAELAEQRRDLARTEPSAAQFVEQRLGLLQISGVEAFGEPAIDLTEHGTRFVAMPLLGK